MISSSKKQPENRIHLFDPVGLANSSRPPRRPPARSHDGGGSPLRFAVVVETNKAPDDNDGSDSSSPRLWTKTKTSTPSKPPTSPDSRTQAIARGRREMMDMIKDLPESSYELSLRDIVDHKSPNPNPKEEEKKKKAISSRSESKKKMARNRSIDSGGFLLKTSVFPVSLWFRTRNKKKRLGSSGSAKPPLHAPPPLPRGGASSESESGGGGFSSNCGSGSGSSSRSSSNASIRQGQSQSNRFLPDCFSFKAKK